MTLDNLLALVALACCPDAPAGLSEQLYGLTRAMATQPDASAELRALAGELTILCLPGVPTELKGIFTTSLQPVLQELFVERMALVDCGDDSVLAPIIKSVAEGHRSVYVKSRAKRFGPDVKLRVTLSLAGRDKEEVDRILGQALHDLEQALATAGISIASVE
jgi:molybdopterin-biosynthesis enzyme MoeA-like protein